jgi:hypothetical protein
MKFTNKAPRETGYYWAFDKDYPAPQIFFFIAHGSGQYWTMYPNGGDGNGWNFDSRLYYRSVERIKEIQPTEVEYEDVRSSCEQ